MAVTVDELQVGDDPEAWRIAGFRVDDDGICRVGTVRIRLTGADGGRHLHGWSLRGIESRRDLDGVPTSASTTDPADPAEHPNGARKIDHVVLATPDVDRTVAAVADLGLEPRRVRDDAVRYPQPMRQVFFRLGEVVLELVGPQAPDPDAAGRPSRFWGIAVDAADLDATAAHLGPQRMTPPKDAVQPGRRIATLRTRDLDISTSIAFMTPAP
jgi:catechol 2,3-dioxygenase-like lactoylglutathione lyase family enzyme